MKILKLLTYCLFLIAMNSYSKEKLVTAFYLQNIPPQLYISEALKPFGGIYYDITNHLADQAGLKAEFIQIPRKRLSFALATNQIDLYCVANPDWYPNKSLKWSKIIYDAPDVIVTREHVSTLIDIEKLDQFKLGTVLGFVYPELEQYFHNGNIIRTDQQSPAVNYKKLKMGVLDGMVIGMHEAARLKGIKDFNQIIINENKIQCAFSQGMDNNQYQSLNSIINEMIISGQIKDIVKNNIEKLPGWSNPTKF